MAFITFQELKYDADGRITSSFIHPKPAAVTLAPDDLLYDEDNRLSTWNGQSVVFDPDGNMTNGPLPSGTLGAYGYDTRNRLTSAGGSTYRYNPDGLRVEITGVGAATFVIDPNAALSRTLIRTKGGTTTYYVYGLGLLYEENGGATRTYHFDQVGSTLALTDGGGNVTDRWSYAPYGAITSHTGPSDTPFQFNGEMGVQTDENGLYHMRARYYNPRLMRFCNADPIGFDGGLNWYAFAGNDPISRFDPFGLKDSKVEDGGSLEKIVVHPDWHQQWLREVGERMDQANADARRQFAHIFRQAADDLNPLGGAGYWRGLVPTREDFERTLNDPLGVLAGNLAALGPMGSELAQAEMVFSKSITTAANHWKWFRLGQSNIGNGVQGFRIASGGKNQLWHFHWIPSRGGPLGKFDLQINGHEWLKLARKWFSSPP